MNTEKKDRPLVGGCAIIVKDPHVWSYGMLKPFSIGIVEGNTKSESGSVSVTFNSHSFKGDNSCSASGGPSIYGVPLRCFRDTGEDRLMSFWKWGSGGPGAGNGVEYSENVPVFEWYRPMSRRRG
jgi:hypothetical protein